MAPRPLVFSLVTALWFLWPQHILFYVLVAAIVCVSRVVVGAHYLADGLAGALIAVLTTRYAAQLFTRAGIDLATARHGAGAEGKPPPWPCRRIGKASIRRDRASSR